MFHMLTHASVHQFVGKIIEAHLTATVEDATETIKGIAADAARARSERAEG
jgi:hypothetical protein